MVAGGCTVSEQSVLSSVERLTLDWPVPPFPTMASSVSPPQHDDDMAIVSGASSWCCSFSCLTRPRTDCTMELVRKPPHDTAPILIGRGLDSCETLFEMKDGPDSTSHCHDTRRRDTTKDLPVRVRISFLLVSWSGVWCVSLLRCCCVRSLSHCFIVVVVLLLIQNEKNEKGQELAALELAFQRVVTLKDPDEPHDDRNESRHHQGTTIRPMLDDDDNSPAAAASTIPTTVHALSLDFEHLHLLDS